MFAADQSHIVCEFEAPLDAVNGGVGFPAKVGKPRDVHTNLVAARKLGKTEVQAAAGDLHTEFVDRRAAYGGVMLKGKAKVARLVVACARAGILAEDLVLRGGGKAGDEGRRNAHAKERMIAIAPDLVDAGGP